MAKPDSKLGGSCNGNLGAPLKISHRVAGDRKQNIGTALRDAYWFVYRTR